MPPPAVQPILGRGAEFFEQACSLMLEGIECNPTLFDFEGLYGRTGVSMQDAMLLMIRPAPTPSPATAAGPQRSSSASHLVSGSRVRDPHPRRPFHWHEARDICDRVGAVEVGDQQDLEGVPDAGYGQNAAVRLGRTAVIFGDPLSQLRFHAGDRCDRPRHRPPAPGRPDRRHRGTRPQE
jgi:hypothetical protein